MTTKWTVRSVARTALGYVFIAVTSCAIALANGQPAPAADDETKIDLRLFGNDKLDGFDGCFFALWQHNRDPQTDAYAYVLYQPFCGDGAPLPAWMKIGKDFHELDAVATGDTTNGGLADFHVFRDSRSDSIAFVDIHASTDSRNISAITDAHLTLVQTGKLPFRMKAKGAVGCPEPAASDAITLGPPQNFDGLRFVPATILKTISQQLGDTCTPEDTPGAGAVHAISDAMSLWQIPCMLGAYQGSSVFVAAINDTPEHHVMLNFPDPPGEGSGDRYDIMSPTVDPARGTVTSIAYARGSSDCGIYERHQLVAVEGEAVEFELLEYREKTQCDGAATKPEQFPLVYSAR
jgi:Protein of unknown function (DUF1176)